MVAVKEFGGTEQTKWWPVSNIQRVVWCPYIPEDTEEQTGSEDDDNAHLLAVTNGKCVSFSSLIVFFCASHIFPNRSFILRVIKLIIPFHLFSFRQKFGI